VLEPYCTEVRSNIKGQLCNVLQCRLYNKQVFSPKSCKKMVKIYLVVFEKTHKSLNSDALHCQKNDVTEQKARLHSNNQLNS